MDAKSEVTMVKSNAQGEREIIVKNPRLQQYVMEQRKEAQRNDARRDAAVNEYAALWASLPVLALLIVWRYKRRRSL